MNSKISFVFLIAVLARARCQTRVGDRCVENYTKTIGKCTPAESCTTARNDYQQNGIRPTFCTYSAFGTTLVCCRDGSSILNAAGSKVVPPIWSSDLNRQSDSRRVSERSDEDYYTSTYPADEEITENDHDHVKRTTISNTPKNYGSPSEEELISQLWAIKLKKLTEEQRRYAEKIINDVLFEAEMGSLNKNHLKMLSSNLSVCDEEQSTRRIKIASRLGEERSVKINSPLLTLQLSVNNPEYKLS